MNNETTVIFREGRQGGVVAHLCGRYAFPERGWRGQHLPQPGEEWEVEIAGQNPRQSVWFLSPVRRVSTESEREALASFQRMVKAVSSLARLETKRRRDERLLVEVHAALAEVGLDYRPQFGEKVIDLDCHSSQNVAISHTNWVRRNIELGREGWSWDMSRDRLVVEFQQALDGQQQHQGRLVELAACLPWLTAGDPTNAEMLARARARFRQELLPDDVREFSDIYGHIGVLAVKHLSYPVEDAWGWQVSEDVIRVISQVGDYHLAGEERQKWLQTPVAFCIPNEEYEKVVEFLELKGAVDVDDARRCPRLMAFYPV